MTAKVRKAAVAAALAVILAAVSGSHASARSIIDAAGRTVEVPDRIAHVLAAGPPSSVILYTLAPHKLIGWTRKFSEEEASYIAPKYRGLPVIGRITGRGATVTPEAVVALHPDLIVDVGSVDKSYAELADRFQKMTGVPYVLLDGTLARSAETYRLLGDIVGERDRASELAAYADETLKSVATTLASVSTDQRPRVYYGRGEDGLETGLAGSINMEVLEAVGAANVAAAAGSGGLARVSMEQILAWNPAIVLTLDPRIFAIVTTDPVWQGIKAVQDKSVYRAPSAPWGWFDSPPGVNRLIGIQWLMAVLYPGQSHVDLAHETRSFYHLFYHVDLTDQQVTHLLEGATSPHK